MFKNKVIKDCQADSYSMPYLDGLPMAGKGISRHSKYNPEAIERDAFEKGYASGEKAGLEMGEQKAAVLLDRLEKILREMKTIKENILSEIEPQVILLSVAMAQKILKEEISVRPEIVEKMVKEAINKISKVSRITIRVNRPLYDLLVKKKEEFREIYPELIFELDPEVPEGGAVVRNHSQEIHTNLDFQLSNIIEDLRAYLGNA